MGGAHTAVAPKQEMRIGIAVELYVGLEEVARRAFPPPCASAVPGNAASHGWIAESLVDRARSGRARLVRVTNVGVSGFAIEGEHSACGQIPPGSLVALRPGRGRPPELGVVIRVLPAISAGLVRVAVRRLSAHARPVEVLPSSLDGERPSMLFVPGSDAMGRDDACLVDQATFERRASIEGYVGECVYSFHLHRVRERGAGWVLAGFEIAAALPFPGPTPAAPARNRSLSRR